MNKLIEQNKDRFPSVEATINTNTKEYRSVAFNSAPVSISVSQRKRGGVWSPPDMTISVNMHLSSEDAAKLKQAVDFANVIIQFMES